MRLWGYSNCFWYNKCSASLLARTTTTFFTNNIETKKMELGSSYLCVHEIAITAFQYNTFSASSLARTATAFFTHNRVTKKIEFWLSYLCIHEVKITVYLCNIFLASMLARTATLFSTNNRETKKNFFKELIHFSSFRNLCTWWILPGRYTIPGHFALESATWYTKISSRPLFSYF